MVEKKLNIMPETWVIDDHIHMNLFKNKLIQKYIHIKKSTTKRRYYFTNIIKKLSIILIQIMWLFKIILKMFF